jgi:hypothetical protein
MTMDKIHFAPTPWPGGAKAEPGDLSAIVPMGMNLDGAPIVMRPWDTLESATQSANYYGLQPHGPDPLRDAPQTDAAGGTVYFDDDIAPADLSTLLRVMSVQIDQQAFAAFRVDATKSADQRFLTQIRIVLPPALGALFDAAFAPELVEQKLTVGAAFAAFVAAERERWGTGMSSELRGTFGGDGDWAKESLCFGFMVENAYHGIYRMWSRAWLVTK